MNEPVKLYLVLSVKEINRLAKAARASMTAHGRASRDTRHCVVLHLDTTPGFANKDGAEQISTSSWTDAVDQLEAQSQNS